MEKTIAAPRPTVGPLAPKIIQIQIDPQKIGDDCWTERKDDQCDH